MSTMDNLVQHTADLMIWTNMPTEQLADAIELDVLDTEAILAGLLPPHGPELASMLYALGQHMAGRR